MRGRNKDFIVNAVLMILSKNYNINISDVQEIDSGISIGENISILKDKYTFKVSLLDLL